MEELLAYWRTAPPTNEIVAAFVGYKAPSEPGVNASTVVANADDPSGIGTLIRQFPSGRVQR